MKKEDNFPPSTTHTSLFVFVNDVDAVYAEYLKAGANITRELNDREYGIRDFDVTDPNGFILVFGKNIN